MAPYFRKHNTKTNTNTARGFNGRSNGYNNITGQWSPLPAVSVGRDNVSGNSEGNGDDGGSGGGSIAETRLKRFDDTKPIAVRYQNACEQRDKDRARLIREGVIDDPNVQKPLEEAITFVGTSELMCPEFECLQRQFQKMVDRYELDNGQIDSTRFVKSFHRPAAGLEAPLPSDVRTPKALVKTLEYLADKILRVHPMDECHGFVRDRTRSIRQDFTYQNYQGPEAVLCTEVIARFHILAMDILAERPEDHTYMETEQLKKCLTSLGYFYSDGKQSGQSFAHEAEFRAYQIIVYAHDRFLEQDDVAGWPTHVSSSPEVKHAMRLYKAIQRYDRAHDYGHNAQHYVKTFFDLVKHKKTTFLMTALLQNYFPRIRKYGLKMIADNYMKTSKRTTVAFIRDFLCYESDEKALVEIENYGLEVRQLELAFGDPPSLYIVPGKHQFNLDAPTLRTSRHCHLFSTKSDGPGFADIVQILWGVPNVGQTSKVSVPSAPVKKNGMIDSGYGDFDDLDGLGFVEDFVRSSEILGRVDLSWETNGASKPQFSAITGFQPAPVASMIPPTQTSPFTHAPANGLDTNRIPNPTFLDTKEHPPLSAFASAFVPAQPKPAFSGAQAKDIVPTIQVSPFQTSAAPVEPSPFQAPAAAFKGPSSSNPFANSGFTSVSITSAETQPPSVDNEALRNAFIGGVTTEQARNNCNGINCVPSGTGIGPKNPFAAVASQAEKPLFLQTEEDLSEEEDGTNSSPAPVVSWASFLPATDQPKEIEASKICGSSVFDNPAATPSFVSASPSILAKPVTGSSIFGKPKSTPSTFQFSGPPQFGAFSQAAGQNSFPINSTVTHGEAIAESKYELPPPPSPPRSELLDFVTGAIDTICKTESVDLQTDSICQLFLKQISERLRAIERSASALYDKRLKERTFYKYLALAQHRKRRTDRQLRKRHRREFNEDPQWWPIIKDGAFYSDPVQNITEIVFKSAELESSVPSLVDIALSSIGVRDTRYRILLHNNDMKGQSHYWFQNKFLGVEPELQFLSSMNNRIHAQLTVTAAEAPDVGFLLFGCSTNFSVSNEDRFTIDRTSLHFITEYLAKCTKFAKIAVIVVCYRSPIDTEPAKPSGLDCNRTLGNARRDRIELVKKALNFDRLPKKIIGKELVMVETLRDLDLVHKLREFAEYYVPETVQPLKESDLDLDISENSSNCSVHSDYTPVKENQPAINKRKSPIIDRIPSEPVKRFKMSNLVRKTSPSGKTPKKANERVRTSLLSTKSNRNELAADEIQLKRYRMEQMEQGILDDAKLRAKSLVGISVLYTKPSGFETQVNSQHGDNRSHSPSLYPSPPYQKDHYLTPTRDHHRSPQTMMTTTTRKKRSDSVNTMGSCNSERRTRLIESADELVYNVHKMLDANMLDS